MVSLTKSFILKLEKNPLEILKELTVEDVVLIIQKANHAYYNTAKPLFTDQIFDLIKSYLEELQPNHPALKHIGSKVKQGVKSKLPFFMGSLDKIKNEQKVFDSWKNKYHGCYVVSDKLDGNSGLLHFQPNQEPKLYTRGNGVEGQNITHILPFLKNMTPLHSFPYEVAIRGELVISKEDFEGLGKNQGANARNTVAGLLNSVIPDLQVARVTSFVAYEVVFPAMLPSQQMKFIKEEAKIDCVHFHSWKNNELSLDSLSNELLQRRKKSPYEIDGIVVVHDAFNTRSNQNPEHAFAFKSVITMDKAEVIVSKVEWNMSKDGVFVPVVHFTPVQLDGVVITKAHGFNAKYILDNSLGAGAVIIVMRSGAVIPYIVETIKKAPHPDMPDTPYKWNKTSVDIVLKDTENNTELKMKNIQYFFEKIEVRGLSSGLIKKLYNGGFKSVGDVLHITADDMVKVEGFQKALATKLYLAIQERVKTLDIYTVMDASNVLGRGFGYKKIKLICDAIPRIIEHQYIPSLQELVQLKGVEETTAKQFITNIPLVFKFIKDNKIDILDKATSDAGQTSSSQYGKDFVNGKTFVFSGIRDTNIEEFIEVHGGKVASSVTKNTSLLVVKTIDADTTKTTKAKTLSIPLMTMDDLKGEIEK
jgi:NAD-dependent DNA ligase